MAAAAASYFSGAALMPTQRAAAPDYPLAGAVAPSPSKSRNPRNSGCVPATVLHIARSLAASAAAAADGGGDLVFSIDGVETANVRVLGKVENVVSTESDVSFTLDDGTGKIPLVRWINDETDALDAAHVQAGVYVRVHVNITGFQAKQQGLARSIRPITNYNEVVLHFIECIHVHMENTRPKMQETLPPAVQTNAYTLVPYAGGVREHQVHFTQVNQGQLPPAVRTSASTYAPFTGGVREHQVHFTPQVNQGQFRPTVQTNRSTHGPFSGGVGDHQSHQFAPQVNHQSHQFVPLVNHQDHQFAPQLNHQSHQFAPQVNHQDHQFAPQVNHQSHQFAPQVNHQDHQFAPQVNQFSAYSGTGGQQHALQSRVLKAIQAPDILSLENGIHIDELARRTGAPKTNIMEVINLLADSGFVCWTIDDHHVKSVCNG